MLINTRLVYIPSINKYLKFREFRNDHLFALFKTQDSLVDSMCAQNDILKDCWVEEEYDMTDLTLLDVMSIFIYWRFSCVDDEMVFDMGYKEQHHELKDWLGVVNELGQHNFRKEYDFEGHKLTFDMLTLEDDFEMQRDYLLNNSSETEKSLEIKRNLITLCALKAFDDDPIKEYSTRKLIYDNLPYSVSSIFEDYQKHVDDIFALFESERFIMEIGEIKTTFRLELIPILIKYMFSGSSESFLQNMTNLSEKVKISFTDFMKMSPMETQDILLYLKHREGEGQDMGDDGEELMM